MVEHDSGRMTGSEVMLLLEVCVCALLRNLIGTRDLHALYTAYYCSGEKWRWRGESEYSCALKTRRLLKNREAENAVAAEIAPNWNVSGTRDSSFAKRNLGYTTPISEQ
jgi:hypothetical protein